MAHTTAIAIGQRHMPFPLAFPAPGKAFLITIAALRAQCQRVVCGLSSAYRPRLRAVLHRTHLTFGLHARLTYHPQSGPLTLPNIGNVSPRQPAHEDTTGFGEPPNLRGLVRGPSAPHTRSFMRHAVFASSAAMERRHDRLSVQSTTARLNVTNRVKLQICRGGHHHAFNINHETSRCCAGSSSLAS